MNKFNLTVNQVIENIRRFIPPIILNNLIYTSFSGSIIYDLWTPDSDIDIVFVFIAPPQYYYGVSKTDQTIQKYQYIPFMGTTKKVDIICYEISTFIELLIKGSYTPTSILWSNLNYCHANSTGLFLRLKKTDFLSRKNLFSMIGYAESQLQENTKKGLYLAYLLSLICSDLLKHKRYNFDRTEEEKKILLDLKNSDLFIYPKGDPGISLWMFNLRNKTFFNLEKLKTETNKSELPEEPDSKIIENIKMALIEQHWITTVPSFRRVKSICL